MKTLKILVLIAIFSDVSAFTYNEALDGDMNSSQYWTGNTTPTLMPKLSVGINRIVGSIDGEDLSDLFKISNPDNLLINYVEIRVNELTNSERFVDPDTIRIGVIRTALGQLNRGSPILDSGTQAYRFRKTSPLIPGTGLESFDLSVEASGLVTSVSGFGEIPEFTYEVLIECFDLNDLPEPQINLTVLDNGNIRIVWTSDSSLKWGEDFPLNSDFSITSGRFKDWAFEEFAIIGQTEATFVVGDSGKAFFRAERN